MRSLFGSSHLLSKPHPLPTDQNQRACTIVSYFRVINDGETRICPPADSDAGKRAWTSLHVIHRAACSSRRFDRTKARYGRPGLVQRSPRSLRQRQVMAGSSGSKDKRRQRWMVMVTTRLVFGLKQPDVSSSSSVRTCCNDKKRRWTRAQLRRHCFWKDVRPRLHGDNDN